VHRAPLCSALLLLCCSAILAPGCGPPHGAEAPQASGEGEIACPAPIGPIPREDCAAVAQEFDSLTVTGALERAGGDATGAMRTEAIRAAAALANQLKEKRVALCDAHNACKLAREEHAAKDKQLADLMTALIVLWDARRFSAPEEVARFHTGIRDLAAKLADGQAAQPATPSAADKPAIPPVAGDKLAQVAGEGVTFAATGGAVTVQAQAGGSRTVLRSGATLPLRGGRRYLVKVAGSYTPVAPALVSPGDEVIGRVRYRATQPTELTLALRSLEDPDAGEALRTFQLAAGEKGAHEASFTAEPAASGFYLAVASSGGGALHLDDVELVRGGNVLAAARAEASNEAQVTTSCAPDPKQPLAGKQSLRCEGKGDVVSLGQPSAWLELAIRGASGDRAVLRTQSLEGGRSLDATLKEDAELVISIAGAGTATVRTVEVRAVEP